MRKKIHIAVVILLFSYVILNLGLLLLSTNSSDSLKSITNFFGGNNLKKAKNFMKQYQQSGSNGVKDHLHPDLLPQLKQLESNLIMHFFFAQPADTIRSLSYIENNNSNEISRSYTFQYDYKPNRLSPWMFNDSIPEGEFYSLKLSMTEIEKNGKSQIVGFSIYPLTAEEKESTKFNLHGKSSFEIGFLIATILIPIFILFSLVQFVRMPSSCQKTRWFIFIAFGLSEFTLNWKTGEVSTSYLAALMLGTGYTKMGIFSPWMISISIPLGALLFLFKKRRWLSEYQEKLLSPESS